MQRCTMASPSDLRKQLRARRRALSADQRSRFSAQICAHLIHSKFYRASRRIASYLAMDAEVDLTLMSAVARRHGKQLHLPVIVAPFHNRLRFAPYAAGAAMRANRFGIPEPNVARSRLVGGAYLDLVLVPLVGFDGSGTRLGMGGGFYDRSFAFRLPRMLWRRPLLIGVAYEIQRVPQLDRYSWDVPLDNVVTENGFLW